MAVDKGYGSGKPRGRGNSVARARVASKRYSKGKKNPEFNLVTKAGEVADFIVSGPKETRGKYAELGVSANKLSSVAKALFSAGKTKQATAVGMRAFAKTGGQAIGKGIAGQGDVTFKVLGRPTLAAGNKELMKSIRSQTRNVFPRSGSADGVASARLQKVADTITKRHYKDVAKKGLGHGDAVNMPRARVLRNLKDKRGIQINKPRGR